MTNREDIVTVKTADGGAVAFSAGQKYSLKLAAGETTDKWMDGSPITRGEYENVLAPHHPFQIEADVSVEAKPPAAAPPRVRGRVYDIGKQTNSSSQEE